MTYELKYAEEIEKARLARWTKRNKTLCRLINRTGNEAGGDILEIRFDKKTDEVVIIFRRREQHELRIKYELLEVINSDDLTDVLILAHDYQALDEPSDLVRVIERPRGTMNKQTVKEGGTAVAKDTRPRTT